MIGQNYRNITEWMEICSLLSVGFMITDLSGTVLWMNDYGKTMLFPNKLSAFLDILKNDEEQFRIPYFQRVQLENKVLIVRRQTISYNEIITIFLQDIDLPFIQEEIQRSRELFDDLNAIFEASWDIIFVADANGRTLRISPSCEKILGCSEKELLGKTVYELEEEGVFKPSVVRMVIAKREKVTQMQVTRTGKRMFTTGIPVFDESGNLIRVIDVARDVTEETKLQEQIRIYKRDIEKYEKELLQLKIQYAPYPIRSRVMEEVYRLAARVANVSSTILITGETGVGKSFLANFIWQQSNRAGGPFLTINCGAIPENLLETELFGYEPGAFTGALKGGKNGLVKEAEGGILFLDEISELPLSLQVKLLQLLQDKTYKPVGSSKLKQADIRIIAATNQDLKEMVSNKKFREDLYYRLAVIPIHIPPLRERKVDIIPLIFNILEKYCKKYNKNKQLSANAIEKMTRYDWPGNIRELENTIERIVVTTPEEHVDVNDLPEFLKNIQEKDLSSQKFQTDQTISLKEAIEKTERELLEKAIHQYKNMSEIAEALGVHQTTISRKMAKYGLSFDSKHCAWHPHR